MGRHRAPERWAPEKSILKPVDKDLSPDEWPDFVLKDAVIYKADGKTMANALLMNIDGPFVVRGWLELDADDDKEYFVRPNVQSCNIQIDTSIKYSLGYDDPLPSAAVWVSGDAGWFEIYPHASYQHIFQDMCEVSIIYHVIVEVYKNAAAQAPKSEKRRVHTSLDIKHLLFEYAIAVGDGTTYAEAAEKCIRLGPLLLAHFDQSEGMFWKTTSIYKWLTGEMKIRSREASSVPDSPFLSTAPPDLTQPLLPQSLLRGLPLRTTPQSQQPPALPATTVGHPAIPTPGSASPVAGQLGRLGQLGIGAPGAAVAADLAGDTDEDRRAVLQILQGFVRKVYDEAGARKTGVSQSGFHQRMITEFRLRTYAVGKDITAFFAPELLSIVDADAQASSFATFLQRAAAARPFTALTPGFSLREARRQLVRRVHLQHPGGAAAGIRALPALPGSRPSPRTLGKPALSPASSLPRTPTGHGPMRTAGKLPALRPPGPSRKRLFSGAFDDDDELAGSNADAFSDSDSDSDSNDDDVDDDHARTSMAVDHSASDINAHRRRGRPPKIARSAINDAMALDQAVDTRIEDQGEIDDGDDDVNYKSEATGEEQHDDTEDDREEAKNSMLAVRSERRLQSTQPTGPNRTWICAEPGCGFYVRDAAPRPGDDDDDDDSAASIDSTLDSAGPATATSAKLGAALSLPSYVRRAQAQIRSHMQDHEEAMLNKMELAIAEGSKGRVSVSYLLDKIRNLGDSAKRSPAQPSLVNGRPAPSPVVRRFLV